MLLLLIYRLCGYTPFYGKDHRALFTSILHLDYSFRAEDWSGVSGDAIDFVRSLLVYSDKRPPMSSVMTHPWITKNMASLTRPVTFSQPVGGDGLPFLVSASQNIKSFAGSMGHEKAIFVCDYQRQQQQQQQQDGDDGSSQCPEMPCCYTYDQFFKMKRGEALSGGCGSESNAVSGASIASDRYTSVSRSVVGGSSGEWVAVSMPPPFRRLSIDSI